jgi:SAM-dependent methyltransferase
MSIKNIIKGMLPKSVLKLIRSQRYEIKGWFTSFVFRGNFVLCPCCGKEFKKFMDYKNSNNGARQDEKRYIGYDKNKICPMCFSLPRHRIVCDYFLKNKKILSNTKILMFGSEYSIEKWFKRNGVAYTTADLFRKDADIKVDIQNIPFHDNSWSLIICNNILEHIPDYKLALSELRRILADDGILELTVPLDRKYATTFEDCNATTEEQRITIFGQADHFRIFGNYFVKIVENAGYSVEILDGNTLAKEIVAITGPADYDENKVYICRKK